MSGSAKRAHLGIIRKRRRIPFTRYTVLDHPGISCLWKRGVNYVIIRLPIPSIDDVIKLTKWHCFVVVLPISLFGTVLKTRAHLFVLFGTVLKTRAHLFVLFSSISVDALCFLYFTGFPWNNNTIAHLFSGTCIPPYGAKWRIYKRSKIRRI